MIKPLLQYLLEEGKPRWRGILLSPETVTSLAVVAGFISLGDRFFRVSPKVSDIATGLISYAAIALGFCVAGLTISLTLPDRDFSMKMARMRDDRTRRNAYSDLLFVFSWTAIAHWCAICAYFLVTLLVESSAPLLPDHHGTTRLVIFALVAGLSVYCLFQFLITLITLSQVGNQYIVFLARSDNSSSPASK